MTRLSGMNAGRSGRSLIGVLVAAALLAAGCGGGSDDDAAESSSTTPVTAASTTTTTASTTTSTAFAPGLVAAPLRGEALDEAAAARPALILKIDNHPKARPQVGLDAADIVFDYRAEGVTRFAAVFHSQLPDPVGPVRSSRTGDFDILRGFNRAVYGSSGGNRGVMAELNELPVFPMTNETQREYFRDGSRPAPHNLLVNATELYAAAESKFGADLTGAGPPTPWFSYALPGEEPSAGTPATGPVTVAFTGSPTVTFAWDEQLGGWRRSQDGVPHDTATGVPIAPPNVVIMVTTYGTSAADASSPEVVSVGSGEAIFLINGQIIDGTWERSAAGEAPVLSDASGEPVVLAPGQTWVLYPEAGQVTR